LANGTRTLSASVPSKVAFGPITVGQPALIAAGAFPITTPWGRGAPCEGQLGAQVLDANGYAVSGAPVQFFARSPGATVNPSSATTNSTGFAFASCTLSATPGANVFVVRIGQAVSDSLVQVIDGRVPGVPTTVTPSGGSDLVGIVTSRVANVFVTDAAGIPVPGLPVQFSKVSASGAVLAPSLPATLVTSASGRAGLTSWRLDTLARADSVRAVVSALPSQPVYIVMTGFPAASSKLRFSVQPTGARAGAVLIPSVGVNITDTYGNTTAVGVSVTLSLVGGPGSLGGTSTVTSVGGVATFTDLTVSAPGTYQLVATSPGLSGATSLSFTVTP
jgi:hypothetical protein